MPAMRIDTECEKKNKVLAAMKKAGLLFGVLAVFAGCRPEPRAEEDPFIPIGMSAGLELSTKAVAGPIMGDNFPVSTLDVFRLTVYATAGDEPSQYDEAYEGLEDAVVNSTGTEGIFELADGPEYYPADGRELYFYAYAPALQSDYTGGAGSMAPFVTFRLDGTQDILWDTVTRGIGKAATAGNQENPDFTFRHKLMLIEFTAKAADGFQAGNLRVKTVRVKDVNLNAILDLVTGRMSYSSPGDLSVTEENGWEIESNDVPAEDLASFAPLMFEPQNSFTIDVELSDGTVYDNRTVTLSENAAPGTSFKVNLTVNRSEITVSATIEEWDPQGNANVTLD